MSKSPDYYELLGISRGSSTSEIKKAYRRLAMKYHPDRNPNNRQAESKFKELTEAYAVLTDPKKRETYDRYGKTPFGENPFSGMGGPGGAAFDFQEVFRNATRTAGGGNRSKREQSAWGKTSFTSLFEDLFKENNPFRNYEDSYSQTQSYGKEKGKDLSYFVSICLEEVLSGTSRTIQFLRINARGVKKEEKVSVQVPKGVQDKQSLKLTGKGEHGHGGYGDLYVQVKVEKHLLFQRKDNQILMDLPISFLDALLGVDELEIPTLDGKCKLKIPAGTHSGKQFRLRGKGLPVSPKGSKEPANSRFQRGDMIVKILVDIPEKLKDLNPSEREFLKKWREQSKEEFPLLRAFNEKVKKVLSER